MSHSDRATNDQAESRIQEAAELLAAGVGRSSVAAHLSKVHQISLRQAQRYVQTGALELMAEPLNTLRLDTDLGLDLHRLDLMADEAKEAGDTKLAITAVKAHASIINARLKTLEAIEIRAKKLKDY